MSSTISKMVFRERPLICMRNLLAQFDGWLISLFPLHQRWNWKLPVIWCINHIPTWSKMNLYKPNEFAHEFEFFLLHSCSGSKWFAALHCQWVLHHMMMGVGWICGFACKPFADATTAWPHGVESTKENTMTKPFGDEDQKGFETAMGPEKQTPCQIDEGYKMQLFWFLFWSFWFLVVFTPEDWPVILTCKRQSLLYTQVPYSMPLLLHLDEMLGKHPYA